jgi:V8-like Glu-specific endopeptidase
MQFVSNRSTVRVAFALITLWGVESTGASAAILTPLRSPIYGPVDHRRDLYQVTDAALLRLADSTVSIIGSENLELDATFSSYHLVTVPLGVDKELCDGENFSNQPSLANCSGALVAPDLVLTAGHCMKDQDECQGMSIAFGFSVKTEGQEPDSLPLSEVFSCKEIVARAQVVGGADFAVIRLDRPAYRHLPLKVNRGGLLATGTPLVVIGHPSGIPAKIAEGARVMDTGDDFKFVANLDTFGGNSGSPVFNAKTGLIEGVLVSGARDYTYDESRGCVLTRHCEEGECDGERSTRASIVAPFIPFF